MITPDPNSQKGELILYTGPMNSGKTENLVKNALKLKVHANQNIRAFTTESNTRDGKNQIKGDNGEHIKAYMIPDDDPEQILDIITRDDKDNHANIVVFDEVSFFNHNIIYVVDELMKQNRLVLAAGLDKDFRGEPLEVMTYLKERVKPELLPHIYFNSYCKMIKNDKQCGSLAHYTVRLREYSDPKVEFFDKAGGVVSNLGFAPYFDKLKMIEDSEKEKREKQGIEEVINYTATCKDCFKIPFKEETLFVYNELISGKTSEDVLKSKTFEDLNSDNIDKIVNMLVEEDKIKPLDNNHYTAFEHRKDLRTGLYVPKH